MDDPFETAFGLKGKVALVVVSLMTIFTCALAGNLHKLINDSNLAESNTVFLFEIVRHGARSPLIESTTYSFPEPP